MVPETRGSVRFNSHTQTVCIGKGRQYRAITDAITNAAQIEAYVSHITGSTAGMRA